MGSSFFFGLGFFLLSSSHFHYLFVLPSFLLSFPTVLYIFVFIASSVCPSIASSVCPMLRPADAFGSINDASMPFWTPARSRASSCYTELIHFSATPGQTVQPVINLCARRNRRAFFIFAEDDDGGMSESKRLEAERYIAAKGYKLYGSNVTTGWPTLTFQVRV